MRGCVRTCPLLRPSPAPSSVPFLAHLAPLSFSLLLCLLSVLPHSFPNPLPSLSPRIRSLASNHLPLPSPFSHNPSPPHPIPDHVRPMERGSAAPGARPTRQTLFTAQRSLHDSTCGGLQERACLSLCVGEVRVSDRPCLRLSSCVRGRACMRACVRACVRASPVHVPTVRHGSMHPLCLV